MGAAPPSLVKYETPVLVQQNDPNPSGIVKATKATKAAKAAAPNEDVLNAILPPRTWEVDGQRWRQRVSALPATRLDVIALQQQLDRQLQQRQARELGICPIREELYGQCLDELIRQAAIQCAERGLLLLRMRDQLRLTLAAYKTLYESSLAFGLRKALAADEGREEAAAAIADLEARLAVEQAQVAGWRAKCEAAERREEEGRARAEAAHAKSVVFLENQVRQLKLQLEGLVAGAKN